MDSLNKTYLIGEMQHLTGASAKAIRLYEKMTIIPAPERNEKGYRLYDEAHIERITLIRKAQGLGFTLSEIAEVFKDSTLDCTEIPWQSIKDLIARKLRSNKEELDKLNQRNMALQSFLQEIKTHS